MTNDEKAALATYGLDQMLESLRRDIADRGPCTTDDYAHMVATLQEHPEPEWHAALLWMFVIAQHRLAQATP